MREQFEAWWANQLATGSVARTDYLTSSVAYRGGYQAGHAAARAEAKDVARSAAGLFRNLLQASNENRKHGYNGLKIEWEELIEAELGRIDAYLAGGGK